MDPVVRYLATDGDSALWSGKPRLYTITVGTAAASAVVTVYDGTTASGEIKALIDASALKVCRFYGAILPRGLFVTLTGGNAKVTVSAG